MGEKQKRRKYCKKRRNCVLLKKKKIKIARKNSKPRSKS